jgi:dolichol-phosphate mannosyltransferase
MGFWPQFWQIVRFLCAGGAGVVLYYLILYTFTDLFKMWYILSAIFASIVNYVTNFILQRSWTFRNKGTKRIRRQASQYVILVGSIFVANLGLLYILVEYTHLHYLIAQVIVTGILTIISYLVSQRIFTT